MKQCYLKRLSSSLGSSVLSSFIHEVFYGFNWKYFTLIDPINSNPNLINSNPNPIQINSNPEVANATTLNFVLWSSHYHTMRRELLYFLRFIAERLQTPLNDLGVSVSSNFLTVYIPGVSLDIRLLIVYRELMTTAVGTEAMYHNGNFYELIIQNLRGPVIFPPISESMMYDETPEMFFNRTGIPVVTPSVLLTEIFQDWELIIETADCESQSNIEDRFKHCINVRKSNSTTTSKLATELKAKISSLTSNHVIDINPVTEDKILEMIIRVVYSQRTIEEPL